MTDLDELRRVLRAREALAPDPGDVLAAATRRIRRRRTTAVAAVTLTVAALGVAAVGLLYRGTAAVPPAALATSPSAVPPATAKVPPAAPALSLEDGSWTLMMWSVQTHTTVLQYGQAHKYSFEIAVKKGAAPHGALPAKPTSAGQITDPKSVMWQDGPDRWIRVQTSKPVTAADMLALLGKIGKKPPVLASPLESVRVPDGQQVYTFTSEPEANTLVLCPDPESTKVPLDDRCFSLFVTVTSRASDSVSPDDPLPVHQHRTVGAYTIEIDSSHANEQAALALVNSVRLSR